MYLGRNKENVCPVCVCVLCVCVCVTPSDWACIAAGLFYWQLVYDVQDGGGCFHLIAVNAENMMTQEEVKKYQIMGVDLPPTQ